MSPEVTPGKQMATAERKNARASMLQLNYLAHFMVEHRELAAGSVSGPQGIMSQKQQWERLASHLNDLPGPEKAVPEWRKGRRRSLRGCVWQLLICKSIKKELIHRFRSSFFSSGSSFLLFFDLCKGFM